MSAELSSKREERLYDSNLTVWEIKYYGDAPGLDEDEHYVFVESDDPEEALRLMRYIDPSAILLNMRKLDIKRLLAVLVK